MGVLNLKFELIRERLEAFTLAQAGEQGIGLILGQLACSLGNDSLPDLTGDLIHRFGGGSLVFGNPDNHQMIGIEFNLFGIVSLGENRIRERGAEHRWIGCDSFTA